MHPWVAFISLILLCIDPVASQARVSGVEGQPVMLPCSYSTAREVTTMCWGRGSCPLFQCSNPLIRTDGYRVTYQRNSRYNLYGMISSGNVSLAIDNPTQADSGTYCCRVEHSGWFNDLKVNLLLSVNPAPPEVTTVRTSPTVSTSVPTMPASTQKLTTAPPKVTSVPTSPRVFTSIPTMQEPAVNLKTETNSSPPVQTRVTQPITSQETNRTSSLLDCCPADGNGTVTQPSDGGWQNGTHVSLEQKPWWNKRKLLYIGIATTALILLVSLATIINKKYLCVEKKVLYISELSSKEIKDGTLQNTAGVRYQANENIYFENYLYSEH